MITTYDLFSKQREAAEITPEGLKVYKSEGVKPCVMIFRPKAVKPYANYSFRTPEAREQYIEAERKAFRERQERMATWKAERKGTPEMLEQVKPGTIFHYSWGYDQTNCEFFQVVERKGTMVTVREIGQHSSLDRESVGPMSDYRMAQPNHFIGEPFKKKVKFMSGTPYLSMDHGWCGLWDGKAKYNSWYA